MRLAEFKQKLDIKYFMVGYIGFLLILSAFSLGHPERLVKGLLMVILYAIADLSWTYARDRIWYLPVSSWISGLILSVVALPDPPWLLALLLPLLAVFSKQVLHFGKMRHVFNPAAFSMAVLALASRVPTVSWWGVAWGRMPLVIVSAVGLFILWRQARVHVTIPFFISYGVALSLLFWFYHGSVSGLALFLKPQLLDGTTIFFATVMLIEPLTSTFPARSQRITYGMLVGFFAVLITYLAGSAWLSTFAFAGNLDPLVFGLCLGNLAASLAFLPWRNREPAVVAPAASPGRRL